MGCAASTQNYSLSESNVFFMGQKVKAKYDRESFYPGVITQVNPDGTYNIQYEDGDAERNVKAILIYSTDPNQQPPPENSEFKIGQQIQARLVGGINYYPGKIASIHPGNIYDIYYNDGEREYNVKESYIKPSDSQPANPSSEQFKVGQKIQARYLGDETYFPGKIKSINANGTYYIKYTDGDEEDNVPGYLIMDKE